MKKTFSNAFTKLVLAGVALVGVFASCQQEDLNATFIDSVNPAEAKITVTVLSKATAAEVPCTITASTGQVSGNVVTIAANSGKEISATTVTVTATPTNTDFKAASTTVSINAHPAGAKANYSARIFIDDVLDVDYYLDYCGEYKTVASEKLYLGDATHSHDGIMYRSNPTEFMLHGTVDYTKFSGVVYDDASFKAEDGCTLAEEVLANDLFSFLDEGITEEPDFYEIWVSAWSYYTVYQQYEVIEHPIGLYKVTASGDVLLASAKFYSVDSQEVAYMEIPYNTHYVAGHGHYDASHDTTHGHYGHGHGSGNAGGGIIYAE